MTAFVFPGQGAQYVGMGADFSEAFAIARQTFEEADDLLGFSLSTIIFQGPETLLTETRHSQLALFVTSSAILRTLHQQLVLTPSVCAGLSLGEYTALFASGRLGFADTLRLVRLRAELMNDACERTKGSMAAVLGLTAADVEEAVRSLSSVWVANYNCPGQIVISGTKEGLESALEPLKAKGAKRVLPLQVHGAFHSGLMESAALILSPAIAAAPIQDSPIEFVMNVPGGYVEEIGQIKENLSRQVTHSVRWEQSMQAMAARGIARFLEIGCGKTLSGLARKTVPAIQALSLDKVADLEAVSKALATRVECNC